jgi:hypothetical protein
MRNLFKPHKHVWRLIEVSERGLRLVEVCTAHPVPHWRVTLHPNVQAIGEQIARDAKEHNR